MSHETKSRVQWDGDALGRKVYADFLYKLVLQRYQAYHAQPGSGSFCMAIDADWGAGKTYFLNRWSEDVTAQQHLVINFDAWRNDLADDPLLGFMSQLREDIRPWLAKLPVGPRLSTAGTRKLAEVMKQARRAVLPIGAVVAKGVIKKFAGVAIEEVAEAIDGSAEGEASVAEAPGSRADAKLADKAIEKFFDQALKSHADKQRAIDELKAAISDLLGFLAKQQVVRLPMFVFVDELDRCRPDYAVRLLEGVKHLFDAQHVCFVFATNLDQLAASTQAVYGGSFDGYRYLKRFFSLQYLLPEPDRAAFAGLLVRDSLLTKRGFQVEAGVPTPMQTGLIDAAEMIACSFAAVSSAFALDLRSQQQVFGYAEAATTELAATERLHTFYLFTLAALLHKAPAKFQRLRGMGGVSEAATVALECGMTGTIAYETYDERQQRTISSSIRTSELFGRYHEMASQTLMKLREKQFNTATFPESVFFAVLDGSNRITARDQRPSIGRYFSLVLSAGQLEFR